MPDDDHAMSGTAVAPDATPDELLSVEETLARGPQPPPDRVEEVARLTREIADPGRRASDPRVGIARAQERRDAKVEARAEEEPMDPGEARAAMSMMLSATRPPADETDSFEVTRLTRQFGSKFVVVLRGLQPAEMEAIQEASLRPATKSEKDRGMVGPVQDTQRMHRLTIASAMLDPNLEDPELLTKFGPRPEDIVRRWFNSGECAFLSAQITDLSGFTAEAVVRAKG